MLDPAGVWAETTSSFLLLLAWHLFLVAMHLFLVTFFRLQIEVIGTYWKNVDDNQGCPSTHYQTHKDFVYIPGMHT